jgi:hypothetical protein
MNLFLDEAKNQINRLAFKRRFSGAAWTPAANQPRADGAENFAFLGK